MGAAVVEFEPLRFAATGRGSGNAGVGDDGGAGFKVEGDVVAPQGSLMNLDGDTVGAGEGGSEGDGHGVFSNPGPVTDRATGEGGGGYRADGHLESVEFDAVEIEDGAIIDKVIDRECLKRVGLLGGEIEVPLEIVGEDGGEVTCGIGKVGDAETSVVGQGCGA